MPREDNTRKGDLKDWREWMRMERREREPWLKRTSSRDLKRESQARQRQGGSRVEPPKVFSARQSTKAGSSSSRKRAGAKEHKNENSEQLGKRKKQRRSPTSGIEVSPGKFQGRVDRDRASSSQSADTVDKHPRENKGVAAGKLRSEEQRSDKSVRGSGKSNTVLVNQDDPTKNEEQGGPVEEEDDFEEMLKRNKEYFDAATLPMEFEGCFDQGSQEGKENLDESTLASKIVEHKQGEGEGRSSSRVQEESLESDMEHKGNYDLNQTISVHSSPEVEVMADVETTVDEGEENDDMAKQHVDNENVEYVKQKLKEVDAQRAANSVKLDSLRRDIKSLQVL